MKESATYQAILEEGMQIGLSTGKAGGEREMPIRVGTKEFGLPDKQTLSLPEDISDFNRLGYLAERLLDVSGWDELLAGN